MVLLAQAQHSVCLSNFPSIFPHKNSVCSSGGALINLWEAVVLFLNFLFLGLDPVWENYSGDVKGIIVVGVVQIHTSHRFKMSSEFMVAGNSLLLSFSQFIIFSLFLPLRAAPSHCLNEWLQMLPYNHRQSSFKSQEKQPPCSFFHVSWSRTQNKSVNHCHL